MYHICPPQCQIQLARLEEIDALNSVRFRAKFHAQDMDSLCRSVRRPVARLNQPDDIPRLDRRVRP